MTIYLIWIRGDESTWLEGSMTINQAAEMPAEWSDMITEAKRIAAENGGEMRIQSVVVPGVDDMFCIPLVHAKKIS